MIAKTSAILLLILAMGCQKSSPPPEAPPGATFPTKNLIFTPPVETSGFLSAELSAMILPQPMRDIMMDTEAELSALLSKKNLPGTTGDVAGYDLEYVSDLADAMSRALRVPDDFSESALVYLLRMTRELKQDMLRCVDEDESANDQYHNALMFLVYHVAYCFLF